MSKEKFIPLNNYVLFKEVEQKKSKYQHTSENYADKVPRGEAVALCETIVELQQGDNFLYRKFQEVPKVLVNEEEFQLVKFEQIYGKYAR
jgi:co-chaperonin GroES (HSP10)